MLGGTINYLATMPEVTINMNCDNYFVIDMQLFNLGDKDEFIFAIKNYSYTDSGYVYLHRARRSDINAKGQIAIRIRPEVTKRIKPGAFYTFAILENAFDPRLETEYKKLTDNGVINIEYGAQDIMIKPTSEEADYDIENVWFEPITDENRDIEPNQFASSRIVGFDIKELKEV